MRRAQASDRFAKGTRIGDYVIEDEVAVEAISMVYLGKHVVLPRHAELRILHAGHGAPRERAVQLLREACLLEALSHPGIPRVYECGVLPDKRPWSALEQVDGTTLGAQLANGPLPLLEVLELVRSIADLLDHLHRRGIVHRKVSADAIVRTPKRRYPICLRQWSEACALDAEGHISLDARDDVHDLGVIAFRALTGHMPDLGGNARDRQPNTSPDVARLIDLMLSIEPTQRPSSAEVRERARNLGDQIVRGGAPPIVTSRTETEDPDNGFAIRISGGRPRSR